MRDVHDGDSVRAMMAGAADTADTADASIRLDAPDRAIVSLGVLQLIAPSAPSAAPFARSTGGLLGNAHVAAITSDVTSIGRGLQNDIVLLDPAVSREHALLQRTATGWCVQNISAQQPVFVRGQAVIPGDQTAIVPGDTLRLGTSNLRLLAPALSESPMMTVTDIDTMETEATGTHVLNPGVTLQFALGGQRHPRLRWLIIALAALILIVSTLATLQIAAPAGKDALHSGGWLHIVAALIIPLLPAIGIMLLIAIFDRYEREPWLTLLGAFAWGALIAIPPTLFFERTLSMFLTPLGNVNSAGATLVYAGGQAAIAGVTEEFIKGAGLVLLLLALRDEFDNVTDGILYGLLIGAGFAVVENFVYLALSPTNQLPFLVLVRIVLGWLSHSTFTALLGAGLGYAREQGRSARPRSFIYPLIGLLVAIALHTCFDFITYGTALLAAGQPSALSTSFLTLCALLLSYGPLLVAQGVLLRLLLAALDREAAIIRLYLADEVLHGSVLPDEYLVAQNATARSAAERRILTLYGLRAYLTARALYQTATGLAFRKWHVAQGDHPKPTSRQPEDAYRERLPQLRHSLYRQMAS